MSIRLMSKVWELDIPQSEKMVLLALADCANDEGDAWPSISTLTRKCSASERTCQRAIKSLKNNGYLEERPIPGKATRYKIMVPGEQADLFGGNGPKTSPNPRHGDTPVMVTPPSNATKTPVMVTPYPLRTVSKEEAVASSPKRARKPKSSLALPASIPADKWAAYVAMRKSIRKPMTPEAMRLAILKLERLQEAGYPPGDVLDQSTFNSWQGLYEIKDRGNGPARRNDSHDDDEPRLPGVRAAMALMAQYGGSG